MTTAVKEGVLVETGEIVNLPAPFEIKQYLQQLRGPVAIERQQQLAAAYDEACRALIGPNDVQKDKGREFKKKSAWRKLARHFGISVLVDPADTQYQRFETGVWLATARAVAVAPWGQRFTDVGACGSDEQTGRRVITMADAIATAMTRAINRAISNLIAMGEVSAEEMGETEEDERAAEQDVKLVFAESAKAGITKETFPAWYQEVTGKAWRVMYAGDVKSLLDAAARRIAAKRKSEAE